MPPKFKILISDLHLGAGHEAEGNALEDFSSDREAAALLDEVIAESNRDGAEVELILNGDIFELLQIPHVETFEPRTVYLPEQYHSSSEPDSALKVSHAIAGHPELFAALARFLQPGPPRRSITFIKGNHDVNLHWPAVQDRIRQAIGAGGEHAPLLTFEERRISREGIYVEHGNQYAAFVDRLDDMDEPHDPDRPGQLKIPPGSWFVMNAFNRVERERYWIDGVKPITRLLWYALAYDFRFAAWAIPQLIAALPGVIGAAAFDVPGPRPDLVHQLQDPEQVAALQARYEADPEFRAQFNAQVARAMAPRRPMVAPADAPPAAMTADPVRMGDHVAAQVHSSLFSAAARRAEEEHARLVILGHTHEPRVEDLPNGAIYINSGTWTWSGDFTGAGKESWRELFEHPERFTNDRRLVYVRIDYSEAGEPSGRLVVYQEQQHKPEPGPLTWWQRVIAWLAERWYRLFGKKVA